MPSSLFTRIDLDLIWPPFLFKALEIIAAARKGGVDYYAVSGLRDFEDQARKYAQGRMGSGKIITNARPGFSMHNYGLAIDFAMDRDETKVGLQPAWANKNGEYNLLRDNALNTGIQVGVHTIPGGDPGHMQVQVSSCFGIQEMTLLVKLRGLYLEHRDLKKCWQWLESKVRWPKISDDSL